MTSNYESKQKLVQVVSQKPFPLFGSAGCWCSDTTIKLQLNLHKNI